MNNLKIAAKNLFRNFEFYRLYLVSVTFILATFFAFISFSMNDIMMEKISTDGRVETMANTISFFLMAFVLFYMSYSNQFFLRSRAKELGIYTLLGYRKAKIVGLLTVENLLVCSLALLSGSLLGAFAHKGIVIGITHVLGLTVDISAIPLFNPGAIIYAAGFVLGVVMMLIISNLLTVQRSSLTGLVSFSKKAEKSTRPSALWGWFGLICIIAGYLLALDIMRGRGSLWYRIGYSPIALLVLGLVGVGTVFFVRSFLPRYWQSAKAKKHSFYRPVNIISIPGFVYRLQTNTRTYTMLAFLVAGTLTITGALALSLYYPLAAISRIVPSEIEFRAADSAQAEGALQLVRKNERDAAIASTTIVRVTSSSENLPEEYSLGAAGGGDQNGQGRIPAFECISESAYLSLLSQQGRGREAAPLLPLRDNECLLIKYEANQEGLGEEGSSYTLNGATPINLRVKKTTLLNSLGFANSVGTLVVPDGIHHQLLQSSDLPTTQVISVNGLGDTAGKNVYEELNTLLDGSPYLASSTMRTAEIIHENSSTFLLLGFLVVLFFIASGSILYFNNLSAVTEARDEYKILSRMGYSKKLIRTIIAKQIAASYSIPFFIGLGHSLFAITCYKAALVQNILGNALTVYAPVIFSYGLTLLIFGIYYVLTKGACYRVVAELNAVV